jgi:hypothetical protein
MIISVRPLVHCANRWGFIVGTLLGFVACTAVWPAEMQSVEGRNLFEKIFFAPLFSTIALLGVVVALTQFEMRRQGVSGPKGIWSNHSANPRLALLALSMIALSYVLIGWTLGIAIGLLVLR